MRREVPIPTLRALLRHPQPAVALAAASGEWHHGESRGQIRDEVRAEWRQAVLRMPIKDEDGARRMTGEEWDLGQILASDPELAFDWFAQQLKSPKGYWYWMIDPHSSAVRGLSGLRTEHRVALWCQTARVGETSPAHWSAWILEPTRRYLRTLLNASSGQGRCATERTRAGLTRQYSRRALVSQQPTSPARLCSAVDGQLSAQVLSTGRKNSRRSSRPPLANPSWLTSSPKPVRASLPKSRRRSERKRRWRCSG
jgi:hypothetical protein